MYAVIKTGGKQYRVAADQKIQIEKLAGQAGDQIEFTDVLMVANGDAIDIGAPFVSGATVVGEIASHDRGPHIIIFKKRRRKHYRRRNGHRQDLTSVTIHEILLGGAKPAKKAAAKPKIETQAETKAEETGKATPVKAAAEVKPKKEETAKAAPVETKAEAKPKKVAKPKKAKATGKDKE